MQTLAKTAADEVEEQHAKDEALLPKPLPEPDKLKAQELEQQLLQVTEINMTLIGFQSSSLLAARRMQMV